jgi:hypothetical protein
MSEKHEYWTFQFTNDYPMAMGPIDIGKPVTKQQIIKYIKKKYETTLPVEAWPHTPWWK